MNSADTQQWVCLQCGYNMIDEMPEICPFCGARHNQFMDWAEAERTYRVTSHAVNDNVDQLLSVPKLGLEHAAYRIDTANGAVWIDCPSAFNRRLKPVRAILFTHLHFMGASNQYRELWKAKVYLHALDADKILSRSFPVDARFNNDFVFEGIAAYHIGGHTDGFTIYIYQDLLFICDYVFSPGLKMCLNPYGPKDKTLQGAKLIMSIISQMPITTVCGYNYISDFKEWFSNFKRIITS